MIWASWQHAEANTGGLQKYQTQTNQSEAVMLVGFMTVPFSHSWHYCAWICNIEMQLFSNFETWIPHKQNLTNVASSVSKKLTNSAEIRDQHLEACDYKIVSKEIWDDVVKMFFFDSCWHLLTTTVQASRRRMPCLAVCSL